MRFNPGSTIGLIGGGQLGRMLILECRRMGYSSAVIDPDIHGPAAQVADQALKPADVKTFCRICQVATYEFEHVDIDMVKEIENVIPVFPRASILEIKRNRISEKTYLSEKGFPVPLFWIFSKGSDVTLEKENLPLVVKTSTGGYDGKGLYILKSEEDLDEVKSILKEEIIVEKFIPYVKEFSIICARDARGNISLYPPGENVHHEGILLYTKAPACLTELQVKNANEIVSDLARTIDLVGLIGVEMFLLADGEIMINEFAPRPHNSGHYSMDGCSISQFEMLLRAICSLPLDKPELLCPTAMLNILGCDPLTLPWEKIFSQKGTKLHLYGKKEVRAKRKIGHINILGNSAEEVNRKLSAIRNMVYREQEKKE